MDKEDKIKSLEEEYILMHDNYKKLRILII